MKLYDLLTVLTDKKTPICLSVLADNGDSHVVYPAINASALMPYLLLFDGNDEVAKVGVGNGCLDVYLYGDYTELFVRYILNTKEASTD